MWTNSESPYSGGYPDFVQSYIKMPFSPAPPKTVACLSYIVVLAPPPCLFGPSYSKSPNFIAANLLFTMLVSCYLHLGRFPSFDNRFSFNSKAVIFCSKWAFLLMLCFRKNHAIVWPIDVPSHFFPTWPRLKRNQNITSYTTLDWKYPMDLKPHPRLSFHVIPTVTENRFSFNVPVPFYKKKILQKGHDQRHRCNLS